jgi:hypothetical protein
MPTAAELRNAQNLLNAHKGNRDLKITITYDEWKRDTDRGMFNRRTAEMEAVDKALKDYHDKGRTESAFVALRQAFENWLRDQQRDGKVWTDNVRNKKGTISKLHEQIQLVEAGRSVRIMGDSRDWDARKEMLAAERDALKRLFMGRTLVFKRGEWKRKFDQAMNAAVLPAVGVGVAARRLAIAGPAVTPRNITDATINICGGINSPANFFTMMGVNFDHFCGAASTLFGTALAPAKLLIDIVKAGVKIRERVAVSRERFMFRPGDADAALDSINRLLDRELKLIAIDATKQVGTIVAGAFQAGPIASLAGAVVDVMVNLKLYSMMADEMKQGNQLLASQHLSFELFNASPVLGSYFLILADTSVWLNFSVFDIGTPGWMDTVERMRKRAEPVRETARRLIRACKYGVSGTEGLNGLEWEASWRNNKLEFIAQHANFDYLANRGEQVVTRARR